MSRRPTRQSELLFGEPLSEVAGRVRPKPITRDEAREAINDLFHRAMKQTNSREWMSDLLTFLAGMRRYSIFNAKLIYIQRPGALAVGTTRYWLKRGRSVRPGAVPIIIMVPKGPFTLVYEYEDTEGPEPQRPLLSFEAKGSLFTEDWVRLKAAVERDGREARTRQGLFRVLEEGLGHGRAGDVQYRRDMEDRYIIRINRNHDPSTKWATLVHELGHIYCGHGGSHNRGWWSDRRLMPGLHPKVQEDIREFEAEGVAWIVAARAGIETRSAEYLTSRLAPLDNERVDLARISHTADELCDM